MEDALAALDRDRARRGGDRDRRVCLCGHPLARHKEARGRVVCQPSRMSCACADAQGVLEVSDTRLFLRKTSGIGVDHALVKGLAASVEAGATVKWIVDVECSKCGSGDALPVGLMQTVGGRVGIAMENPQATRFLCAGCIEEM